MPEQNKLLLLSPGELLSNARHQQGRTIEDAADYLKLGREKIEAMEADQWDRIAPAYCKGFARRYARYLKLSATSFETALESIKCEKPAVKSIFSQHNAKKPSSPGSFRVLTYLVGTVFIVLPLVLAYTHFAVRWSQDEPLIIQPHLTGENSRAITGANLPLVSGNDELQHLQANMMPVGIVSTEAVGGEINDRDQSSVSSAGSLEIELSADSWLSVIDAEGKQLEANLRAGGQTYSYQGKPPFQLQIGRVSATRVRLNDEMIDLQAFSIGDIANLEVGAVLSE
ncbi:MAG: DUF4115 domain-containing protein [Proteobacteria bacterium]|nr:DUF4115 domain-containing protein [Pseudomonadota bacterium]